MVTLRTYSNPAEAAMAKSLLDDHKIPCSLADENVNLYGGGPLAMPIRLLVAEDQAQEASRILATKAAELPEDFDPGSAAEASNPGEDINQQVLSELRGLHHTNQWILLIASVVLVMAVYLIFEIPHNTNPWSPVYQAVRGYNYEKALTLTKRIVKEHPDDYYGHEYLGYIYLQMGNLNLAELEYSRACELAPPKGLQEKLEEIRKRREHESRAPNATPIASP
jgi:tetratricopeptide (TPR) repeat protein